MIEKTLEVLKQFETQEGAKLEIVNVGIIEKRPEIPEIAFKSFNSPVQVCFKDVYEGKLNQVYKKLQEIQVEADFDTYREAGGKFKDFGQIDNVFDQAKTHLVHKLGEVFLVDVWATWCGPCQKPMKHNQEMLEKNEVIWGDKVKIIGVSVDDQKDVIKERVTSKKWQKVTHLTLLGWKNDHALIKEFKINGIPFICLVDKWGNINYTGHPSEINLETRINQLLNEQQDSSNKPKVVPAAAPETESNSKKEIIEKVSSLLTKQNIQKEFKDVDLICFKFNKRQKYEEGALSVTLNIDAYYVDGDQVAENLVKKLFDTHEGVELKINTVKYTPIPQSNHYDCSICQTKDLQYPFYWLKWEEGSKFGCTTCVQKKSQVQGHHFAYQKNSVLLLGKWEKVSTKDLGGNLQPADVTKVNDIHSFGCNGCEGCPGSVESARYVALGVRSEPNFKSNGFVDLCQNCMKRVIEKDQEIISKLLLEGHQDNHPFLRILYNTNGYYEF